MPYTPAAALLCVDIIASSVGGGGAVAGIQQVHQLALLNLLRVAGLVHSLNMTSGLRAHLHRQHLP